MYSPELETLDQLCGGDLPITIIRKIYRDEFAFNHGLSAMLNNGDVRLLRQGSPVPMWEISRLLEAPDKWDGLILSLTDLGAQKIR